MDAKFSLHDIVERGLEEMLKDQISEHLKGSDPATLQEAVGGIVKAYLERLARPGANLPFSLATLIEGPVREHAEAAVLAHTKELAQQVIARIANNGWYESIAQRAVNAAFHDAARDAIIKHAELLQTMLAEQLAKLTKKEG